MATNREEIIIRAGFDGTALASGLRQTTHQVKDFAKEVGRDLLSAFSAAAIVAQVENIFRKVEQIKSGASKTGIDVEAFQKLSTVAAEDLPQGAEKFEAAITKLNVKLGQGAKEFAKWGIHAKDAEGAMYEIADRMKAMEDPAQKAAMAVDLMGKSGADMVPLLERGAAALKAAAGEKLSWSKEDLEAIKDAHDSIEKTENAITIGIGKAISGFSWFFSELGRLSATSDGDRKERAHQEMQSHLDAIKKKDAEEAAVEDARERSAIAEKLSEEAEKQNAQEKENAASAKFRADEEKKITEQKRAQRQLDQYYRAAAKIRADAERVGVDAPTLDQLAGRGYMNKLGAAFGAGGQFDLGAGDGPGAKAAQDALYYKNKTTYDLIHGLGGFDKDGNLTGQAKIDRDRGRAAQNLLGAMGLDTPAQKFEAMKISLNEINDNISDLLTSEKGKGLNVNIPSK